MLKKLRPGLPSPAMVVAIIALVVALGGSAYAAHVVITKPGQLGKNVVTSKQIKKNAVIGSKIKKNSITGAKVKNDSLTGADINEATLAAVPNAAHATNADHASVADGIPAPEPFHLVGSAGQPAFGNGGEGDCLWANAASGTISPPQPFNPVAFYKSADGVVHLTGVAQAQNGPGGDAMCGGTDSQAADGTVFTLPDGYRPPHLLAFPGLSGGSTAVLINGDQTVVSGTTVIPPGVVVVSSVSSGTAASFDGIDFRLGGAGTGISAAAPARVRISQQTLRSILGGR